MTVGRVGDCIPDTVILDRRLVVVTGKGGVGKTTVAAALGVAVVRTGRRALICEASASRNGCPGHSGAPQGRGAPVELAPGLYQHRLDPQDAVREWMRRQPGGGAVRSLARQLGRLPAVRRGRAGSRASSRSASWATSSPPASTTW